jgi:hypothetical protein
MLAKVANDKCKIAFFVAGSIISLAAWDMKREGLE